MDSFRMEEFRSSTSNVLNGNAGIVRPMAVALVRNKALELTRELLQRDDDDVTIGISH